jgi:predicted DsbA family dithiol-disulfide isomerase
LAHELAVESPHVTADVIEIAEFPDLAQRYHVQGVPKTVINEQVSVDGAVPESRLLALVLDAAERERES